MDPYNDPTWIPCGGAAGRPWIFIRILHGSYVGAQRAGSGGAWFGGHGKLCYRIGRQCVVHKHINIISGKQKKNIQNVNISSEICAISSGA